MMRVGELKGTIYRSAPVGRQPPTRPAGAVQLVATHSIVATRGRGKAGARVWSEPTGLMRA
jgi:hypothetical protein